VRFAFIAAADSKYPVAWMCRHLEVSNAGYYAWKEADESDRAKRRRRLEPVVKAYHKASHGTYGSRRIHTDLKTAGEDIGRNTVAAIMRDAGIQGVPKRRFRKTTDSDHDDPLCENILDRQFDPDQQDTCWAADITYLRTKDNGWLYLAVVIDLFSRRVVGWAIADTMHTALVLSALKQAFKVRQPGDGLLHHSDRGSQYTSRAHRQLLEDHSAICSMSRKAECWDNAVVESFFGTFKQELIYGRKLRSSDELITAVEDYIDRFYNVRRRHSKLGNISPLEYELHAAREIAAAA